MSSQLLGVARSDEADGGAGYARHHCCSQDDGGSDRGPVPLDELAHSVAPRAAVGSNRDRAQEPFHVLVEGCDSAVPIVRVFGQRLVDDRLQLGIDHLGWVSAITHGPGLGGADGLDGVGDRAVDLVGAVAGEQLVQDDSESVHVAAEVDAIRVCLCLLWAHVGEGSDDGTVSFDTLLGGAMQVRVSDSRQPEVQDLDHRHGGVAVVGRAGAIGHDHDVLRFEVVMDHPALVGVANRLADRLEQPQPRSGRHREVLVHPGVERLPLHQLHGEEVASVVGVSRFVDRRDVRVPQTSQGLGFTLEQPGVHLVDMVTVAHDLERHGASWRPLLGLVHEAHAARSEQTFDAVARDRFASAIGLILRHAAAAADGLSDLAADLGEIGGRRFGGLATLARVAR